MGLYLTAWGLGWTLLMSDLAVADAWRDSSGARTRARAGQWARGLCRRCGVRVAVEGGEGVDWERPLVVMANHQSLFDIPVLLTALPRAFGFLAKKELFGVPAFGRAIRALGCVSIDRGDRRGSHASIAEAAQRVRAGASLVVFPEGTRSPDGRIRPLKKGPFHLVQSARVPVVPAGIHGTRAVLSKDGYAVRPGDVRVRVGTPLGPPDPGADGREALRAAVREALVRLSGNEPTEAGGDTRY